MGINWTDDDAKASHDRAVTGLLAIAMRLAEGRDIPADAAIAREVRLSDAAMWADVDSGGPGHE
ncbi:MAG: hypothetical protein HGA51_03355 [Demequinaceae bacterium]|nr:hypothetical protein [Demequinaceae bacterium]